MLFPRVFRRKSDDGHSTVFRSRVSGDQIVLEFQRALYPDSKFATTLSKEDARRYAEWLLAKAK